MIARLTRPITLAVCLLALGASPVVPSSFAQTRAKPRPAAAQRSRSVQINGYAMIGRINLTAIDSFEAITGRTGGPIFGGGARVGLPVGGLFVDVGAWRYQADGERVLVSNGVVYPLNVPVEISMTPIELSAGWQFRFRRVPKFTPYVAAGLTSMRYRETSSFADASEDVEESFSGYHVIGGAQYRITRWMGLAGEASWTTVPDAIGEGGASAAFNETDLGGTTFRLKITIGR
ncbi:MAG TPA: hypothetical protein VNT81_01090 [Vicinamibacterales bacterium]|nr:hypothetical protein [Vicinamibacterales bacterium]